jgi:hypothetical protein
MHAPSSEFLAIKMSYINLETASRFSERSQDTKKDLHTCSLSKGKRQAIGRPRSRR